MRYIIPLLVLLILLPVAHASFDKWMYPGESFTFQGVQYFVIASSDAASALLRSENFSVTIPKERCREENFIQYCYPEHAEDDFDKIRFDASGNLIRAMRITLEQLGPSLKVSATHTPGSPKIREDVEMVITIENTGNRVAYDIVLLISHPAITLKSCSQCISTQSSFTRSFVSLSPDQKQELFVRFASVDSQQVVFLLNASYEDDSGRQGTLSQSLRSMNIQAPYKISRTYRSNNPTGFASPGSISLSNTGTDDIIVFFDLPVVQGLDFSGALFEREIRSDGVRLVSGASRTIGFTVLSPLSGSYDIPLFAQVDDGRERITENLSFKAVFTTDSLSMESRSGKRAVLGGDTDSFTLTVRNPGTRAFRDVSIDVSGPLIELSRTMEYVPGGDVEVLAQQQLTYPVVEEATTFDIVTNMTYRSSTGEARELSTVHTVTVYPIGGSFELRRVMTPKEPDVGERFNVKVYGRRVVESTMAVERIHERIEGARIVNGIPAGDMRFGVGEFLVFEYDAIREDEYMGLSASAPVTVGSRAITVTDTYQVGTPPEGITVPESGVHQESEQGSDDPAQEDPVEEEPVDEPQQRPSPPVAQRDEPKGFFQSIAAFFRRLFGRG